LGVCALGLHFGYLVFHVLAEGFSIVIAMSAVTVTSASKQFTKDRFLIYIGIGIGWCAVLDVVHTLAFKGVDLLPVDGANTATQLWIAARYLQAAVMISAPLFLSRSVRFAYLNLGFALFIVAVLVSISTGIFPDAYIEGEGLTPFKIYSEYLIILMLAATMILLLRRRASLAQPVLIAICAALVAMIGAEFAFTRYGSVYDSANMVGHLLKILAYWFMYVALVKWTLREPFRMLADAQQALRESEFRWKFAVEGTGDGLWDWNVPKSQVFYSSRWKEMLGFSEDEVGTSLDEWSKRVHPDDLQRVMVDVQAHLDGLTPVYVNEHRVSCKDGSWKWILDRGLVVERDAAGKPLRVIGTHADITERKQLENQVHELAFHDTLTNLPDRRLLFDRLSQTISASKRSGNYCALMMLDLDNFKPLNDKHGHQAGDMLLIEVARRLIECVRESDTVARVGGDEFVVLLGKLDADKAKSAKQALDVAEKIRASLARPYQVTIGDDDTVDTAIQHHSSASIGVVLFVNDSASKADILQWADEAMYLAKEGGRNTVRFYGIA
jgi:diguanylate cyclase (GGDEF)-like protein/PAS domain S-box-containing protein